MKKRTLLSWLLPPTAYCLLLSVLFQWLPNKPLAAPAPQYVAIAFTPTASGGVFALVAHGVATGSASSETTAALNMTGANLLVLCNYDDNNTAPTPTDSLGNTWTPLTEYISTNVHLKGFYAVNPTVGASQTFSTGTGSHPALGVAGFSGAKISSVLDTANGSTGVGTSSQPGAVGTQTGELLWSCQGNLISSAGLAINSGFNLLDNNSSGVMDIATAYLFTPSSSAVNPTWSWNTSEPASVNIAGYLHP
jgi:hypothetical protein